MKLKILVFVLVSVCSGCAVAPSDPYKAHAEVLALTRSAMADNKISTAEATYLFIQAGSARTLIDYAADNPKGSRSKDDAALAKLSLERARKYLDGARAH